jgi:hypothetical protein
MERLKTLYEHDSGVFTASGHTDWLASYDLNELLLGLNLTAIRGTNPSITFFVEFKGADDSAYPLYSPNALTAIGAISQTIGEGKQTDAPITDFVRLRWVVAGTAIATTVGTGANSATQELADTTGMAAGDTLHFATAAVNRVIDHVVDGTHVVLTAAVNSTDGEAVTATNTPDFTFSTSLQAR